MRENCIKHHREKLNEGKDAAKSWFIISSSKIFLGQEDSEFEGAWMKFTAKPGRVTLLQITPKIRH